MILKALENMFSYRLKINKDILFKRSKKWLTKGWQMTNKKSIFLHLSKFQRFQTSLTTKRLDQPNTVFYQILNSLINITLSLTTLLQMPQPVHTTNESYWPLVTDQTHICLNDTRCIRQFCLEILWPFQHTRLQQNNVCLFEKRVTGSKS